jgi:plastocyanin
MTRTLAAGATALVLVLAGCGGSSNSSSSSSGASGGGEQIALAAPSDGSLKFDKTTLAAKAGTVTINFDNPSGTPHAVAVEGNGVDKDGKTVTKGKDSLTVDLKPGTYEFYCPVDGHRQAGMKGTLTVK